MIGELFVLSVLNLLRARTRMIMTTGGILVATTGIVLLVAFALGLQNAAESGLGSNSALTEIQVTGSGQSGSTLSDSGVLTPAVVKKLGQISGVTIVIPMVYLQDSQFIAGAQATSRQIIGIDPALLADLGLPLQTGNLAVATGQAVSGSDVGKNFPKSDNPAHNVTFVDIDVMSTPLRLKLTQTTSASPTSHQLPLKVVGLLKSGTKFDSALFLPLADVISMNTWVTGNKYDPKTFQYDLVIVHSASRDLTNQIAHTIQNKLALSTSSLGDLLDQMNSFFTTMHLMLGGIGLIMLLVAASGVANTMMMATHERTKEIGLMKAIGSTDENILTIFLLEAALIGLAGSVGGVGLSLFLQGVINRSVQNLSLGPNPPSFLPVNLSAISNPIIIPPELALFAVALAVLVSVGAGFYPALWAARLPPVLALKQE